MSELARLLYAVAHGTPLDQVTKDDQFCIDLMDKVITDAGPTEVRWYDSTDDDGRGGDFHQDFFSTRTAAEGFVRESNQALLDSQNAFIARGNEKREALHEERYQREVTAVAEHNALVVAGLRAGPTQDVPEPTQFVPQAPKTDLRIFTYPEKNPTERNGRWGTEDHYFIREIEYRDK